MGRCCPAHPASTPRFRDWSHLSKWTLAPSWPLHPPSPRTPRPQPLRLPQGPRRGRDTAPSSPAAQDAPAPPPRSTVEGSERPATQTEGPRGPSREVLSHPGQGAAVTAGTTRQPAYAQGAGQVTARVCGWTLPQPSLGPLWGGARPSWDSVGSPGGKGGQGGPQPGHLLRGGCLGAGPTQAESPASGTGSVPAKLNPHAAPAWP